MDPGPSGRTLLLLRCVLVIAQAAVIALTWQLWQVREHLPPVSAFDLPAWDAGPVLLLSLIPVLVRPLWGTLLHMVVLALAMVQDELRMQPHVVFLAVLMVGTLPLRGARVIGVSALTSLWIWAGLHKLLSDDYLDVFGRGVVEPVLPGLPRWGIDAITLFVAFSELAMGLGMLLPLHRLRRIRWIMAGGALLLHVGIVAVLYDLGHNPSVWPWNGGVAIVAAVLVWTRDTSWREDFAAIPIAVRAIAVAVVLLPAGYYVRMMPAYFSFALYSCNAPRAWVVHMDGSAEKMGHLEGCRSFIPPCYRNFRHVFQHTGRPGERIELLDSRAWAERDGTGKLVEWWTPEE